MPAVSQGSTVSFATFSLGELLGWDVTPCGATFTDGTGVDCAVVGSGSQARVLKKVDCSSVDPGTASVTFLGSNGFGAEDVGMAGTLSITSAAGSISLDAILSRFTITASVGELIKGVAEFQFTGNI